MEGGACGREPRGQFSKSGPQTYLARTKWPMETYIYGCLRLCNAILARTPHRRNQGVRQCPGPISLLPRLACLACWRAHRHWRSIAPRRSVRTSGRARKPNTSSISAATRSVMLTVMAFHAKHYAATRLRSTPPVLGSTGPTHSRFKLEPSPHHKKCKALSARQKPRSPPKRVSSLALASARANK